MAWVKAASLADLREKPTVFRHGPLQIAIFHIDSRVFAIDNRCPHEGYPLVVGTVSPDCLLTCNWHNWKFKLEDGTCVIGGDNVRSYPTRLDDGAVWVDTTPPTPDEARRKILHGLRTAFDERDYERLCREIARFHYSGLDLRDAVRAAVHWFHNRLEFGNSHAFPGIVDWLALADTFHGDLEKKLICFSEAIDHMAFDALREREYPYAPPGEAFNRGAFLSAVENQERHRVEGMVSSALAGGRHWADLQESFAAAALRHYNNFGHSVIYVQKASELLATLGEDVEPCVVLPLSRGVCYASREDLIPEFKDYAATLKALPEPREISQARTDIEVPFPINLGDAFQWLHQSLGIYDVKTVYDALLTALARNLLHYDTEYDKAFDRPVSSNVSWLDFTHGVTFSNAVRDLCSRYPHLWRPGLLQMACFLGRNHAYVDKTIDVEQWRVREPDAFFARSHEELLDHGLNEPIFAVHLLKTMRAVEAELPFASSECREALLASLNRYLHSSVKLKHVRRLTRQAIALVSRDFEK